MLQVRDIMTPNVVTIASDRSLREAIDILVSCRIGGVPVTEGEVVVGVLAAADIIEFEALAPPPPYERDDAPAPLEDEDDASEGEDVLSAFFTDLWSAGPDVVERMAAFAGAEWDFLSEHTVAEAMSRSLCTVPESMEVTDAAQHMLASTVQRALVMSSDGFTGILTTTDILRAVAERRLSVRSQGFADRVVT